MIQSRLSFRWQPFFIIMGLLATYIVHLFAVMSVPQKIEQPNAAILAAILLLMVPLYLHAQVEEREIQFAHLKSDDGLSQNAVNTVLQDDLGFIWFGTFEGIDRWDGHRFRHYRHDPFNKNSLSNDVVMELFQDAGGNIWVGTADGINKIDAETDGVVRYLLPENADTYIYRIRQDSGGRVWALARGGLYYLESGSDRFQTFLGAQESGFSREFKELSTLCMLDENTLLVGSISEGVFRIDLSTFEIKRHLFRTERIPNGNAGVSSLFVDSTGHLWLNTWNFGIVRQNLETGELVHYYQEREERNWLFSRVNAAAESPFGTVYLVARDTGLLSFDLETERFSLTQHEPDNPLSLVGNTVVDVMVDDTGTLWVATAGMGVSFHSPQETYFVQAPELTGKFIYAFEEASGGDLWVGGYKTGLVRVDKDHSIVEIHDAPEYSKDPLAIRSLLKDSRGRLWVGTSHTGVYLYSAEEGLQKRSDVMEVWDLLEDAQGRIWAATDHLPLFLMDPDSNEPRAFPIIGDDPDADLQGRKSALLQDDDGTFWLGTGRGLLSLHFDGRAFKVIKQYSLEKGNTKSLASDMIISLLLNGEGLLYVGTRRGLSVLDIEKGTFTNYTVADGLPNNVIYSILQSDSGDIWCSTNRGLSRFNPQTEEFNNYYLNNGLQDLEFNTHAVFKREDGRLYFGGVDGINYLDPQDVTGSDRIPNVLFSSFRVSGQEIGSRAFINSNPEIALTHADNNFTFEMALDDLHAASLNTYAYKVEGLEQEWHYTEPGSSHVYHNLPPGEYSLKIRGANSEGNWSKNERYIRIRVTPLFYQTAWFWNSLLAALVVLTGLFFLYRYRLLRNQQKLLKLQLEERTADIRLKNRQLEERTRELEENQEKLRVANQELKSFSYTVSHDLQSPINTIRGFIDLLGEDERVASDAVSSNYIGRILRNLASMEELIQNLLKFSRSSNKKLEPGPVNISLMCRGIAAKLQEEFAPAGFEIDIEENLTANADESLLKIALHNLMHNAFKYSKNASSPTIAVGWDIGREAFYISDNGVGFDPDLADRLFKPFERLHSDQEFAGTGIGLATVHRIIARHGGCITAETEEGRGATFWFSLP